MGRQVTRPRPALSALYPRPGEPIVPRLLQEVVFDRHPSSDPGASDLYRVAQAGVRAWKVFPAELCRRVAMTVVDRAQSRLPQLPQSLLSTPLPDPGTALSYSLERRTINTLERTVRSGELDGRWTLGRYLSLPRLGGRAVVDLLSAVEAHEGPLARRAASLTGRQLEQEVVFVVRNLPISEPRVQASLREPGVADSSKVDLARLARDWVRRGHLVPFRLVALGGIRIAVAPAHATAARTAYRTAARAIAFGGSASVLEIATQLTGAPGAAVDATFIERLFSNLVTFRWVDRPAGVFWFAGATTPFVASVRKTLANARSRRRLRSSPLGARRV
jgi:hypothetical protein